jgi:hypothetical protein
MTWPALAAAVESRLPVVARGEDWLGLEWSFAPSVGAQSQRLQLVSSRSSGLLVLVICELGTAALASSTPLLELNMTMRFGAAAVYRGRGVLRHAEPLERLAPDRLAEAATYLAATARRIRSGLIIQPHVHEHFAD